jgi:hypothetical protein
MLDIYCRAATLALNSANLGQFLPIMLGISCRATTIALAAIPIMFCVSCRAAPTATTALPLMFGISCRIAALALFLAGLRQPLPIMIGVSCRTATDTPAPVPFVESQIAEQAHIAFVCDYELILRRMQAARAGAEGNIRLIRGTGNCLICACRQSSSAPDLLRADRR